MFTPVKNRLILSVKILNKGTLETKSMQKFSDE